MFLTAGLAIWLDLSFLLAGIACGAMVVNTGRHHTRPFYEIEHIEWPFMIFFFVLAGAALQPDLLLKLGLLGAAYVLLRLAGRLAGGWLGGKLSGGPEPTEAISSASRFCPRRASRLAWPWLLPKCCRSSGTKF